MAARFGILVFPNVQQLDLTGPYEVFASVPGSEVHLLWKDLQPLTSATGLRLTPTTTFEDCPRLDVLCVPGGAGVNPLLEDTVVHDFLRQRRRIHAGHLRVRAEQAYSASTMSAWRAARALVASEASFRSLRTTLWSIGTVGLEAIARILGCYDVIRGRRPPGVWKMANTTKSNIAEAINYGAHEDYRSDFEFSELRLEGGRIFASQISLPSKPGVKSLKLRTY